MEYVEQRLAVRFVRRAAIVRPEGGIEQVEPGEVRDLEGFCARYHALLGQCELIGEMPVKVVFVNGTCVGNGRDVAAGETITLPLPQVAGGLYAGTIVLAPLTPEEEALARGA